MGIYIAGVTWFARNEADKSSRFHLVGAAGLVNAGLILVCLFVARPLMPALVMATSRVAGTGLGEGDAASVLSVLAVIAITVNYRLIAGIRDPKAVSVQTAVKTMLLSVVMLDAALVHFKTGEPMYSLATAALLIPAVVLARRVYIT
jgi:4-hydroxybenzoate polyprenyltransferase